jgi:hypothetical protein
MKEIERIIKDKFGVMASDLPTKACAKAIEQYVNSITSKLYTEYQSLDHRTAVEIAQLKQNVIKAIPKDKRTSSKNDLYTNAYNVGWSECIAELKKGVTDETK